MSDQTSTHPTAILIGFDFATQHVVWQFGELRALQAQRLACVDDYVTILVEDGPQPFVSAQPIGAQLCRVCGCSDDLGCEDGCDWAGADICSSCATKQKATTPADVDRQMQAVPHVLAAFRRHFPDGEQ